MCAGILFPSSYVSDVLSRHRIALDFLSRLSCPGCPVSATLSLLSCSERPVLSFLSWLEYPNCPLRLSSPGYLVPVILSWLSCPGFPVHAFLFKLSFACCSALGFLLLAILPLLLCLCCHLLVVLSCLSYTGCPIPAIYTGCPSCCPVLAVQGWPHMADQKWNNNNKEKKELFYRDPKVKVL